MTLKEKLEVEIMDLSIMDETIDYIGKNLEYVADDFAIGFAEWKDNNCFKATGIMLWYINMDEEVHGVYNVLWLHEVVADLKPTSQI
jgi:hypothetical protein